MVEFLNNTFSAALKTNDALERGILTGCLKIAKESTPQADFSLFLGLNNLKVHTVASSNYASYFGFVEEEVKAMLEYYGLPYSDAVKAM